MATKKTLPLILVLIILSFGCTAQIIATTKDGRQVILKDDSTWTFIKKPSAPAIKTLTQCDDYFTESYDKITGKTSIVSKKSIYLIKNQQRIELVYFVVGKTVLVVVRVSKECVDDKSKVSILFKDNTRIVIANQGEFNCDGDYSLYLGADFDTDDELSEMSTKRVASIRFTTYKGYIDVDLTDLQATNIQKTSECAMLKAQSNQDE